MSKRHSAKYKIDRAMGENLWGRSKSPVNKRSYGPGQHGQRRKSKVSDFGLQLKAKQKLKGYYGNITEKQFAKTYELAARKKGNTAEALIGLLEARLDAVVYRAKFVPTVWAARQFVNHGHVTVNGKKVNIASYSVKIGDVVEVKEKSRNMALVLEAQQSSERDVPDYLEIGDRGFSVRYVRVPELADVPFPVKMEPNLVVEYYAS
ncbi:MAG: 30S ribosomal protein S4 [Microcystis flos-aquae DF17]|jgi:small subunit ribosomal protein S4|uniref:30S ribosomal protein S4 n=1 Tax=Brevundimonas fluminis TaxID=2487274 RepID=UPI000E385234|nr:30S ribosomal protein S4 [Brevundimonas fluminis]REJ46869.1 MAG: 30S ribosomal protein S4 [Microcystis flos-aquae DF17]